MNRDLAFALELAERADPIALASFGTGALVVERKPDGTPVTDADRAVEEALFAAIRRGRPADGVLGEELGLRGGGGDARWIVDPIDGTRNYVRGIPVFATLIALERDREIGVAVVSAPALGRRWWAVRGEGSYADGRPLRVSRAKALEEATCSYSYPGGVAEQDSGERFLALARRCLSVRGFGDFWQHMLVAEGGIEIAVDPVASLWDLAGPKLIVEEAGGRFTDLAGAIRADGGSGISSNGLLHEEVLAALSGGSVRCAAAPELALRQVEDLGVDLA